MPRSVFVVPVVAGAIMFVGTIGWALAGAIGLFECAYAGQVPADVMAWSFLWLGLAMLTASISAGILATRVSAWLAAVGTLLTLAAIILAGDVGWVITVGIAGCERSDEGPALTLFLFSVPSAAFGYVIGWLMRRAGVWDTPGPAE